MHYEPDKVDLKILQLLKMRWDTESESGKSCIVDLDELLAHLDLPKLEVGDRMTVLETTGLIEGVHTFGDLNPGYWITDNGKTYVILQAREGGCRWPRVSGS